MNTLINRRYFFLNKNFLKEKLLIVHLEDVNASLIMTIMVVTSMINMYIQMEIAVNIVRVIQNAQASLTFLKIKPVLLNQTTILFE